jgi:hypothetical protein
LRAGWLLAEVNAGFRRAASADDGIAEHLALFVLGMGLVARPFTKRRQPLVDLGIALRPRKVFDLLAVVDLQPADAVHDGTDAVELDGLPATVEHVLP